MSETIPIQALIQVHAEREAAYADLFKRVAPEAFGAQNALSDTLVKENEARRKQGEEREIFPVPGPSASEEKNLLDYRSEHLETGLYRNEPTATPIIRLDSRAAQAMTLQPVRDTVVDGIIVLSEDRKLDIIGHPYPNLWIHKSGNAYPSQQTVWADPGDGTFGFSHKVAGEGIISKQANSGAGIYVQFAPRIAPGIAQVRPFLPFSFQWSNLSFKSREDNSATFSIRIWSWNAGGGDFFMEQDHRYFIWNDTSIARYLASSNNRSWYTGSPPPPQNPVGMKITPSHLVKRHRTSRPA